jgi:hypothetical protein
MTRKTKEQIEAEMDAREKETLDALHDPKPSQMENDPVIRYEAECVKPCTFRGQYWDRGRVYRGFIKPPEGLFEIIEENEVTARRDDSRIAPAKPLPGRTEPLTGASEALPGAAEPLTGDAETLSGKPESLSDPVKKTPAGDAENEAKPETGKAKGK